MGKIEIYFNSVPFKKNSILARFFLFHLSSVHSGNIYFHHGDNGQDYRIKQILNDIFHLMII